MSWVWIAIRLIDRASPSLPSRSSTRAGFSPRCGCCATGSASTISSGSAPASWPGGTIHSAFERRSVGTIRFSPRRWLEDAQDAAGGLADPAQGAAFVAARSHRLQPHQHPLARRKRGRALRSGCIRIIGGGPALRSHSTGRASASPSRSVPVICTTAVSGNLATAPRAMPSEATVVAAVPRVRLASMLNSFRH